MTVYINVSNTFRTLSKTGIQRVVREVVSRLILKKDITLIVWFKTGFYQLSLDQEISRFLAARAFVPQNKINIVDLKAGDVFFDLDGSAGDIYEIKQLFQRLKKQGIILIKMHYDAVPILLPQFSHINTGFSFTDNFTAALQFIDYWLCISQTVRSDLLKIADGVEVGEPVTQVIPLGADFNQYGKQQNVTVAHVEYGQYILVVGTLEPRKNHTLILDVFDQLLFANHNINLVIVGKRGWSMGEIVERIENHPQYNKRLFWLINASDSEIAMLYKNAFVTTNLSHYEGYGLPVIESLSRGCVTLCASNTAMEEVSRGAAYSINADVDSVVYALQQLQLPNVYAQYKLKAEQFLAPTWTDSANKIANLLDSIQLLEGISISPKQAVYISIRADALYRSLCSVIKQMEFISKVVILTSDKEFTTISNKLAGLAIDIRIVKESELGIHDLPDDHQVRNTYLRRKLYKQNFIENNFIALDDDNLAIEQVSLVDFLEDGKHKAYYYYADGRDWLGAYPAPTSFDLGVWRTVKFLHSSGYDTKLYNSHMPQIINKKICNTILNRTASLGLDEWSSYFNIASHLYPQFFQDQFYRAISWPPDLETWLPTSPPEKIIFQNYYDKDADLSTINPKKIANTIKKWQAEYSSKKAIQESIVPANPTIIISRGGLNYTGSSIHCHKDTKIMIKLLVEADVGDFKIMSRFDIYENNFSRDALPRYLLIPAEILNPKGENNIQILLSFSDTEESSKIIIPVTIVDALLEYSHAINDQ